MTTLLPPDLDAIDGEAWWQAMAACPKDPVHHPEGDVATHTRMVLAALAADPRVHDLSVEDRAVIEWAALLHDCGKPATTRHEDGRLTSRGHSRAGAILARRLLWEAGAPFAARERICALVRAHMRPSFLLEQADPKRELIWLSHITELPLLDLLSRADARGRGTDPTSTLARLDLFADYARELGVWQGPWPFANDESRFEFFRRPDRSPHYTAYDDRWGEVIVMSGLPAAGKDSWIIDSGGGLPVVSLDAMREELGLDPDETAGGLIAAARERAREHLRARRPFIWNATNLSRDIRSRPIALAADYGARIRVVYVESAPPLLHARNQARERVVPAAALERMLERWEVPDLTESHSRTVILSD